MLRPFAKMLSLMKHCLLSKNGMTNSIGEGNCELMLIGGYLKEPSTANSRAIAYTRQPPLFFLYTKMEQCCQQKVDNKIQRHRRCLTCYTACGNKVSKRTVLSKLC
jgi:hypothetical protein